MEQIGLKLSLESVQKSLVVALAVNHKYVLTLLRVGCRVRVQAVNAVGVGAFSAPIKVTTRALPPYPPVLELASVGSNSVKLKWGDGKNVDMLRYVLEMRRDDYGRCVLEEPQ